MKKNFILILLLGLLFCAPSALSAKKKQDPWKLWLAQVEPIISSAELSTAKLLKTEEERIRFKAMFWKARDPQPQTPENPYQTAYFQRVAYAQRFFNGIHTDRGKIYVILGEPAFKSTFSGRRGLVDCELWSYEGEERPELPPFMDLVFFRPRNVGDFMLYHPGVHSARDLLSPELSHSFSVESLSSLRQAYGELKNISTRLASASLSIVPGQGDPLTGGSAGLSNFTLNRIFGLPEKEAELAYLRNLKHPVGSVDVSHSTKELLGHGYIAVAPHQGLNFVHYALMPDSMSLKQTGKELFNAQIHLHVNIETLEGHIIYQHRRSIIINADPDKKNKIERRKLVFRDMVPVIDGRFNVVLTFRNITTAEFFTYTQEIDVHSSLTAALCGYDLKEMPLSATSLYKPFGLEEFLVLTDPRANFNQKETLYGIIACEVKPDVLLRNSNQLTVPVSLTAPRDGIYKYRLPLNDVKDGTYQLTVTPGSGTSITRKIHVLPRYIAIQRPLVMEHPQPAEAVNNFLFVLGQQYLEIKRPDLAVATFERIPTALWKAEALPVFAQAYYQVRNDEKVIQLLSEKEVEKVYPVLLMLGNAAIRLKRYNAALEYLQAILKYGETAKIYQLMGAVYLNLGDKANSRKYYERARRLKN